MNRATIRGNFPALWSHLCRVYRLPGVRKAVDLKGILAMYYFSGPLATKAGITVAPLPDDFEEQLASGGVVGAESRKGAGDLLGATKTLLLATAAFAGGLAAGVALSGARGRHRR